VGHWCVRRIPSHDSSAPSCLDPSLTWPHSAKHVMSGRSRSVAAQSVLQLLQDSVQIEGRRLLSGREVEERCEKLANDLLRR
jgi:hypothetical protein